MQTTIDAGGRIVVPKPIRDALALGPGTRVDLAVVDGRIEIEVAPVEAHVEVRDGLSVIVADEDVAPLSVEQVRDTLAATRR